MAERFGQRRQIVITDAEAGKLGQAADARRQAIQSFQGEVDRCRIYKIDEVLLPQTVRDPCLERVRQKDYGHDAGRQL